MNYMENIEFQKGIKVKVPDVISDELYSRITIKSKLDLESIAVFAESNSQESLRAIFIIQKGGIIDYTVPIVITDVACEKYTKIIVVGKGRDDTMYQTTSSVRYCACEYACIDN